MKVSPAGTDGNIAIPTTGSGPQGPTGQVANTTSSFPVKGGDGNAAHFIFANLNGTISAWDSGTTAFTQVTTPGRSLYWTSHQPEPGPASIVRRQRCGFR